MKDMKELMVYFCDDTLSVLYQDRIIKKNFKSIEKGQVIDAKGFMDSFLELLKKEKIKSKLFGDKIYVVKDAYHNVRDLFFLENLFTQLGFVKVIFFDIKKLFRDDYTYIGVYQDYIVFYLDDPVVLTLNYFKDIPKMIDYFKGYYHGYVLLFGSNENIPNIQSNLVNLYYIDDFQNYVTQSLPKVKKYGA